MCICSCTAGLASAPQLCRNPTGRGGPGSYFTLYATAVQPDSVVLYATCVECTFLRLRVHCCNHVSSPLRSRQKLKSVRAGCNPVRWHSALLRELSATVLLQNTAFDSRIVLSRGLLLHLLIYRKAAGCEDRGHEPQERCSDFLRQLWKYFHQAQLCQPLLRVGNHGDDHCHLRNKVSIRRVLG